MGRMKSSDWLFLCAERLRAEHPLYRQTDLPAGLEPETVALVLIENGLYNKLEPGEAVRLFVADCERHPWRVEDLPAELTGW